MALYYQPSLYEFNHWWLRIRQNVNQQQPHVEKIYLHIKDPLESGYQLHINKREKKRIGNNSQTIENLEDYNLTKKGNVLTIFDDMVADTEANKNKPSSC